MPNRTISHPIANHPQLDQMLEKAVAQANSYFMDHNLMLGVINVGGLLTKSRLCIPMLYFDTTQCRVSVTNGWAEVAAELRHWRAGNRAARNPIGSILLDFHSSNANGNFSTL